MLLSFRDSSARQLLSLYSTASFFLSMSMIALLTISCPLFLCLTKHKVSTWFANARRRLKKENKMTWEPRNKTNDCHEEDDADDDKESLNGSEDNLSSSGGIGDNSTTTSLLTPLPPQHHHHHSVPSSGPSSVVNQVNNNNSSHALVPHHLQSHANQNVHQQQQLQPLHHRTTASSSSSPPPSPRSLLDVKTDSGGSLMEGRTSGDSSSLSCDKNHSRMKAPSSSLHSSGNFCQGNCHSLSFEKKTWGSRSSHVVLTGYVWQENRYRFWLLFFLLLLPDVCQYESSKCLFANATWMFAQHLSSILSSDPSTRFKKTWQSLMIKSNDVHQKYISTHFQG